MIVPKKKAPGRPKPAPPGGIVGPLPPDVSPLGWPNVYPPGTIQNFKPIPGQMHPLTVALIRAGVI